RRDDVDLYKRNRAALKRYLDHVKPGRAYGPEVQAAIDYHGELGLFEELRDFLLALEPCAPVWSQLGQVYAALGQPELARQVLEKAISADKTYPWPHVNLGRMALQQRDLGAAIDHFGRALVADPQHVVARDELVRALAKAGRKGEARAIVAKMDPGP